MINTFIYITNLHFYDIIVYIILLKNDTKDLHEKEFQVSPSVTRVNKTSIKEIIKVKLMPIIIIIAIITGSIK